MQAITTMGDIAKSVFQVHGVDTAARRLSVDEFTRNFRHESESANESDRIR